MKDEDLLKKFAANTKKDLNRFENERIMKQWVELLNNLQKHCRRIDNFDSMRKIENEFIYYKKLWF